MTQSKNKLVAWLLLVVMTITMLFGSVFVSADYTTVKDNPLGTLKTTVYTGKYTYITSGKEYEFNTNRYKKSGGGYELYTQLFGEGKGPTVNNMTTFINSDTLLDEEKVKSLTPSARQDFLGDMLTIAQAVVNDTENGYHIDSSAPTDDTMADFMELLQQQSGMGASLLATLMQNTNPDYSTANRIYEPFSGTVGTILGVVSIFVMALLGVTMALDIAYITIPAFQMALGGDDNNGKGGKKGISAIISPEARNAAKAAEGGGGGQGGSGEYKAAIGIYFKYRWKGLVMLAICLLYLVQGEIYSFIGWFIDLFSGFLGM